MYLFEILQTLPFVDHKGREVNSDRLPDQWDERCVLGLARIHREEIKADGPEITTAHNPKFFDGGPALQEQIWKLSLAVFQTSIGSGCNLFQ